MYANSFKKKIMKFINCELKGNFKLAQVSKIGPL